MEYTEEQRQHLYEKLKASINEKPGFSVHNGLKITKLEYGCCEGEMQIRPESLNSIGIVHGGCLVSLADNVAGMAICSTGVNTITVDCNFSFLRAAKGSYVRCVAQPEKLGGKLAVIRCVLTDDQDKTVATGQFTFLVTGEIGKKKG